MGLAYPDEWWDRYGKRDKFNKIKEMIDEINAKVQKSGDTMTGDLTLPSLYFTGNLYEDGVQGITTDQIRSGATYDEYSDASGSSQSGSGTWTDPDISIDVNSSDNPTLIMVNAPMVRNSTNDWARCYIRVGSTDYLIYMGQGFDDQERTMHGFLFLPSGFSGTQTVTIRWNSDGGTLYVSEYGIARRMVVLVLKR